MAERSNVSPQHDPPEPHEGDLPYVIGKTVLAGIPGLGGAASEVFGALVKAPAQRRLDGLIEDVMRRLDELERQGRIDVKSLPLKDPFVDTAFTRRGQPFTTASRINSGLTETRS